VPTATVPPPGQLDSGAPPLAVSRTAETQVPLQLTIEIAGTSVFADAPVNWIVKPPLPAPFAVCTVPAKPGMALIAAVMLAVLTARPPAPSTAELWPPIWTWNDCVAPLKPVSTTCCCSLPPWRALAMPAAVLFWPRTIGTVSAPL
jgi:hypothetical protein